MVENYFYLYLIPCKYIRTERYTYKVPTRTLESYIKCVHVDRNKLLNLSVYLIDQKENKSRRSRKTIQRLHYLLQSLSCYVARIKHVRFVRIQREGPIVYRGLRVEYLVTGLY